MGLLKNISSWCQQSYMGNEVEWFNTWTFFQTMWVQAQFCSLLAGWSGDCLSFLFRFLLWKNEKGNNTIHLIDSWKEDDLIEAKFLVQSLV